MCNLKNRVCSLSATLRRLALAAAMGVLCTLAIANPPCPSDLDGDKRIDTADLSLLLLDFGTCAGCSSDVDGDGTVNAADISLLLLDFGQCPVWYTVLEQDPNPAVVYDSGLRAAIAATGLPWRVRDNGTGIEMVLIPPGSFAMGCSSDEEVCESNEYPTHQVTLTSAFYLGRTELTEAQWYTNSVSTQCCSALIDPTFPMVYVTWSEAQAFCSNNDLRLPTEAEWEFAYRAGSARSFHWIYSPDEWPYGVLGVTSSSIGRIAWNYYNTCMTGRCGPRVVGSLASNYFGLFDMAGNVSEWVNDWYSSYSADDQIDPSGPLSGTYRVKRGGDCGDWWSRSFTASSRTPCSFDFRDTYTGFRVAKTP